MLKIYFSYASGSGATSAMLDEVASLQEERNRVVVSLQRSPQDGKPAGEPFDLDGWLNSKPDAVAIDDLAQINPTSARNKNRYQDVQELLRAGIDVYATLKVTELQGEADRIEAILGEAPQALVPDKFLYDADEIKFVDIAPEELRHRYIKNGVEPLSWETLIELRRLAVKCINKAYAIQGEQMVEHPTHVVHESHVAALVMFDSDTKRLIHESARLSKAIGGTWSAVYVDTRSSADRHPKDESRDPLVNAEIQKISALARSLGGQLVVLRGEEVLQTFVDYVRTQNITDLVVSRRPSFNIKSIANPYQRSFFDRLTQALPQVCLHTIASNIVSTKGMIYRKPSVAGIFHVRPIDLVKSLLVLTVATILSLAAQYYSLSTQIPGLIYVLGIVVIARYTLGYIPGIVSAFISVLLLDYFFIIPHGSMSVQHPASLILFVVVLVVSLLITMLSTRLQREAERSRFREQHTQALYDFNRRLFFVRDSVGIADESLASIVRLFGRSAIFYLQDPFTENAGRVLTAPGDIVPQDFGKIIEKDTVAWVFKNQEAAGAGTNTNVVSDVLYLPVMVSDEVRGVLGVSCTTSMIEPGERHYLEMMVNHIALALERQRLLEEHKADMQQAKLDEIRARYALSASQFALDSSKLIQGAAQQAHRLNAAVDQTSSPAFVFDYRRHLDQFVAGESERAEHLMDVVHSVLDTHDVSLQGDGLSSRLDEQVRIKHTRARSQRMKRVLQEVVAQAVSDARELCPHVTITLTDNTKSPLKFLLDREMMRSAIIAIISYAAFFAPRQSQVDVEIKVHNKTVIVSVSDMRTMTVPKRPLSFDDHYSSQRRTTLSKVTDDAWEQARKMITMNAVGLPFTQAHQNRSSDELVVDDKDQVQVLQAQDDEVIVVSSSQVVEGVDIPSSEDDSNTQLLRASHEHDDDLFMHQLFSGVHQGELTRATPRELDRIQTDLALAASAIRAHGGGVRMRARLGGGAVTSFWLPREPKQTSASVLSRL